jgi:CelD/BcsL family acetyltransferase involved in cellulose biosynthesis
MRFRVLDAADESALAEWLALWGAWPRRDPMAHPELARLFARPHDRTVCAVGEDVGGTILLPLLLRPLAAEPWARAGEERWDATTPYGYGGPFVTRAGAERDDAAFWRAFEAWCAGERIVSTFARLSLFPEDLATLPANGRVEERLVNVVVPLAGGAEALWRGYDTKVRRWIRASEAAGVEVEVDQVGAHLDEFHAVYTHTMERNGAAEFYFFPRAFFAALAARLAGSFAFFLARAGGEIVSTDLVLCAADRAYYFLGGTLERAFPLGPNYLVKHRVACWAAAQGMTSYVLGGGHAPGDTLHRYKRAYARHGEVPFRVASLVHDELSYRELCADRSAAAHGGTPWTPQPGFFPAYRG